MPVRCEIKTINDKVQKVEEIWPAADTSKREARFVRDYSLGRLARIIGVECDVSDLFGMVYIVDDPKAIFAVNHGTAIEQVLSDDSMVLGLPPETSPPVEFPVTTKYNHIAVVALSHVLPPDEPISVFPSLYLN